MKITDVKAYVIGNPWKNWVFVKLFTDEGITGLGEVTSGQATKQNEASIMELRHLCLGENPCNVEAVCWKLRKNLAFTEDLTAVQSFSAINLACYDILGKALNVPVYKLLGGKTRERVRAYANGWYQGPRDPAFFAKEAKKVADMGYTALKFDPFGSALGDISHKELLLSMDIVGAVRDAVGADVDLLIEAHDRFRVPEAIKVGRALEEFHPMWYEAPVLSYDVEAINEVAKAVPVPVAAGERFSSTREIFRLMSAYAVSVVQPETYSVGGITGVMECCGGARAMNSMVAPHSAQSPYGTAANVHIGTAAPNFLIQECFDDFHVEWAKTVLSGYPKVVDGYLTASETPGIGVELDEKAAAAHPYDENNFLRLFDDGWEKRRIAEK